MCDEKLGKIGGLNLVESRKAHSVVDKVSSALDTLHLRFFNHQHLNKGVSQRGWVVHVGGLHGAVQ